MDLFRRCCLALSGLNGDIQTLWPSAAPEAVAPCGHGRPNMPGAGHTSCLGPATLPRPPSSVGRRVIPKSHPSSHPSCHSQSLAGLQLRGHTWAWLPHMPRCRVESGGKPLHALVGLWGVGQEGRVPAGLTTPGALAAPFHLWVLLRRDVTGQPAGLLEFSQMLTGPLCPWDLLGLRLGSLRRPSCHSRAEAVGKEMTSLAHGLFWDEPGWGFTPTRTKRSSGPPNRQPTLKLIPAHLLPHGLGSGSARVVRGAPPVSPDPLRALT